LNELKTLASTQFCSPHIIGFYDAFYFEGKIQIVMEYMDGGSLADVLAKKGAFPENVLKACCAQIVKGLGVLAKHHIIHRGIFFFFC
jgi:mitogen-activated protein kinase kinase 1